MKKLVEIICLTITNPQSLPNLLQPEHNIYSVLDLKDAFFFIPLPKLSQPIFTFELRILRQVIWSRLPQGSKNSPITFDEAFNQELSLFCIKYPEVALLQYVTDLLLTVRDEEDSLRATQGLLETLAQLGCRVSKK